MIASVGKVYAVMISSIGCRSDDHFSWQGFRNDEQFYRVPQ
jgi:hypothetical protein